MDPSEFPTGVEPVRGLVLMDPLVLFTALAIAVLILGAGYYFGRRRTEEKMWANREDACKSVHKAILDRARSAAAATRPQVMAGAQALSDEIHKLLGPVATLGTFGGIAERLRHALEGKPEHAHGHDDHGHDDHAAAAHGEAHGKDDKRGDHAAATSGGIHINIGDIGGEGRKPEPKPGPNSGHGKPGVDIDAIRKAVLDFTDYWSRPTMVGELRAAQKALLTPAPPPKPKAVPNLSSSS